MENKTLSFISTHIINKAVISEYKKMNASDSMDVILVVDNTCLKLKAKSPVAEMEFFGEKVKCFLFNENIHKDLKLPSFYFDKETENFSEIMWYNADYRFYYVKKFFPQYEYYWQFDYDIFMNGKSYNEFFNKYQGDEDLLICNYGEDIMKNSPWTWTQGIDWAYDNDVRLKASFYPVCRLKNKAIDYLYKKRIEHGKIYKKLENKTGTKWLNCEIFTPTELFNAGYNCKNINEPYVQLDKEYDLNEDRIFENPDNLLYHPVKGDFINRLNKEKAEFKNKPDHLVIKFLGIKMKFKANSH